MNFSQLERDREDKKTLQELKRAVNTQYQNSVDLQGGQQKKRSRLMLLYIPVVPLSGNMQPVWTRMHRHQPWKCTPNNHS